MHQALSLKSPEGIRISSERTVYRIIEQIGLGHRPKRKSSGITKANREAQKSDDLLHRNFTAEEPCAKCITDITGKDGKVYVSGIFDCFDLGAPGLNMRVDLCVKTLESATKNDPELHGAIVHFDRGAQYTRVVPERR